MAHHGKASFKTPFPSIDAGQHSGFGKSLALVPRAQDTYQLMRTTQGRLRGDLDFRNPPSGWYSAPCYIETATNGLWCEVEGNGAVSIADNLIGDLRGCEVRISPGNTDEEATLQIVTRRGERLILRPRDRAALVEWFAALLCWQPCRPQLTPMRDLPRWKANSFGTFLDTTSAIRLQGRTLHGNGAAVVKIDKAILVDESECGLENDVDSRKQNVTCVLRADGQLTIQANKGAASLVTVYLDQMPRPAIQRVRNGVFGVDKIVALYPQYARSPQASSCFHPIYLSFENMELHQVWFILLRAFADADVTPSSRRVALDSGTELSSERDLDKDSRFLRVEQGLEIRIDAIKLERLVAGPAEPKSSKSNRRVPSHIYIEILLDEQVRARTATKAKNNELLHWYESYMFRDFGNLPPSISIRIKEQDMRQQSARLDKRSSKTLEDLFQSQLRLQPAASDFTIGSVTMGSGSTTTFKDFDGAWQLSDERGAAAGEVTLRIRHKREGILCIDEYSKMSHLLQNVDNRLSVQLYEKMATPAKLAELFLDVFEATGQTTEWLQSLIEWEVFNGVQKPAVTGSQTVSSRGESAEAQSSLQKNAPSEAFLLFRGNTLLSRAVDAYMKLKGFSYLEQTIGSKLREVQMLEIDCEVDPSRVESESNIRKNWNNLKSTTEELWSLIYQSASFCPTELRQVFSYIREQAERRYGGLKTTRYTSVSGFLFLRFFCAAVLNPQLFGLVSSVPGPRAQRTFMLVAKSLQGLANLTSYGYKEPWMEPMNEFCASHTQSFKEFIDMVCVVSPIGGDSKPSQVGGLSSYSAVTLKSVYSKLPPMAREGLPVLPSLKDPARSLAALVDMWLDDVDKAGDSFDSASLQPESDLLAFHSECLRLRKKSARHARELDAHTRGSDSLSPKWATVAEKLEANPEEFLAPPSEDKGWSGGSDSAAPSSVRANQERRGSQSGSEKSSRSRRGKRASPPRDPSDNALRKLGWI